MLAVNCPDINLLGVSTVSWNLGWNFWIVVLRLPSQVHGNSDADCTQKNAARCLYAFGGSQDIGVYPGAAKPLIRPARHDPEIHGVGAEILLSTNAALTYQRWTWRSRRTSRPRSPNGHFKDPQAVQSNRRYGTGHPPNLEIWVWGSCCRRFLWTYDKLGVIL